MENLNSETTQIAHFRIGDGFGVTLMTIAQEHLMYNLDPQKAFATISESLMGCPDDLALLILKGDMVLPVDEDTQEVICVEREDIHETIFPKIEFKEWLLKKSDEVEKSGDDLAEALDIARRTALKNRGYYSFDFNYKSIFEFLKGNTDPVLQELYEDEELTQLGDLIRVARNFIETAVKVKNVSEWVKKSYPELDVEYDDGGVVMDVMSALKDLINVQEIDTELETIQEDTVTSYIQNIKQIDEVLSKGIKPVDILDNYSAGWLSPEGMYYALNGDIVNMLHNEIATALYKIGIIPEGEDNKINPDVWLEQNGWVKIHENNVQYAGNLNSKNEYSDLKDVYMTDLQKEIIVQYITDCHQCKILLGWKRQPYSIGMFGAMDRIALHKHFEF